MGEERRLCCREVHADHTWECRWDRHPNPHNTRDHFHPPPTATTPGEDASWPTDHRDVVALVLAEIERFLDETGIYTNKSEFIKEACRSHLRDLNDETAIAALRVEQLLTQVEQSRRSDSDIEAELAALGEKVDPDDFEQALEDAREETSENVYGTDA